MTNEELIAAALLPNKYSAATVARVSDSTAGVIFALRKGTKWRNTVEAAKAMGVDAYAELHLTKETVELLENEEKRRRERQAEKYRNATHAA